MDVVDIKWNKNFVLENQVLLALMDFLLSHILFKLKNCMFHNFLNFIKLIAVPPHCRRRSRFRRLYTFYKYNWILTYLQAPAPIFTTKRHFSLIIFRWIFRWNVKWCLCDCCYRLIVVVVDWCGCCAAIITSYFFFLLPLRRYRRVFTPATPRRTKLWQIL